MGYQTSSFPTFENVIDLVERVFLSSRSGCAPELGPVSAADDHFRTGSSAAMCAWGSRITLYLKRGQKLRSNAEVVERTVRIAHELNREIATTRFRRVKCLGFRPPPSRY